MVDLVDCCLSCFSIVIRSKGKPFDSELLLSSEVQQSYAKSLKARDMGHSVLRQTWREGVNLLGEMAAVIVDGEIFKIFVASQR